MSDNHALQRSRKTGSERLKDGSRELAPDVLSFWQWSASDLVSNTMRGVLAEYIVALALGLATDGSVRREWDAYDLLLADGTKVEVKSAAYVQSWRQDKPSTIQFKVTKRRAWDAETNIVAAERCRSADVYVFALLSHADRATIDPLDLSQWRFFVLPTAALDARERSQHSITLKSLEVLAGPPVPYSQLGDAVRGAADLQRAICSANE